MEIPPSALHLDDLTELRGHHVLACVDRFALGNACLTYAISLASALDGELTLVHVMDPQLPATGPHPDPLGWEIARLETRAHLERLEAEAAHALGRPVGARLEQGRPAERIITVAHELGANITVLGGHREGNDTAWRLGSTTQEVVSVSRGSVFVAHPGESSSTIPHIRRILVPLDGSRRAESVLPTVARLARAYHAELLLVHVVQEPLPTAVLGTIEDLELARKLSARMQISAKAYLEGVRAALQRETTTVHTRVVRHANQRRCIVELSQQEHTDLIVVAAHGAACDPTRPFGSVTADLLAYAHVSFLVLQDLPELTAHRFELGEELAPMLRASYPPELA